MVDALYCIKSDLKELNKMVGNDKLKQDFCDFIIYKLMELDNGEMNHIVLEGGPGTGKCLDPYTEVLMYDYSVKYAKDIEIGDKLMGDDNMLRNVVDLGSGEMDMYNISYMGGNFVCNKEHILTLFNINDSCLEDVPLIKFINNEKDKTDYLCVKNIYNGNRKVDSGYMVGYNEEYDLFHCDLNYDDKMLVLSGYLSQKFRQANITFKYNEYYILIEYYQVENNDKLEKFLNSCGIYFIHEYGKYKCIIPNKIVKLLKCIDTKLINIKEYICQKYDKCYNYGLSKWGYELKGNGKYNGFVIDGNHRFLLKDNIITHNTTVANILAKIFSKINKRSFSNKVKLITARRSDLIGEYLGQTTAKTQKVIDSALGGVLLIDEAYSLGNSEKRDSYAKECIDTINQNLTENGDKFICIIAGYKDSLKKCFFAYNPGLERRFPWKFSMDTCNAKQMSEIMKLKVINDKWKIDVDGNYLENKINDNMDYFNNHGGDIENWFVKTKISHAKRIFMSNKVADRKLLKEDDFDGGFEKFKMIKDEVMEKKEEIPYGIYN